MQCNSWEQFLFVSVMIVINHYLAFSYFSSVWHPFHEVRRRRRKRKRRGNGIFLTRWLFVFLVKNSVSFLSGSGVFHCLPVACSICVFRVLVSKRQHFADSESNENRFDIVSPPNPGGCKILQK